MDGAFEGEKLPPRSQNVIPREVFSAWMRMNRIVPQVGIGAVAALGREIFAPADSKHPTRNGLRYDLHEIDAMPLEGNQKNSARAIMRKIHAVFGIYFEDEKRAMSHERNVQDAKRDLQAMRAMVDDPELAKLTAAEVLQRLQWSNAGQYARLNIRHGAGSEDVIKPLLQDALENAERYLDHEEGLGEEARASLDRREQHGLESFWIFQKANLFLTALAYVSQARPHLVTNNEFRAGNTRAERLQDMLISDKTLAPELHRLFSGVAEAYEFPDVSLAMWMYRNMFRMSPHGARLAQDKSAAVSFVKDGFLRYAASRISKHLMKIARSGKMNAQFCKEENVREIIRMMK